MVRKYVPAPSQVAGTFRSLARMIRQNWIFLRPKERLAAVGIATCSLVSSVIELAALSTVVPFVGLLIDAAALDRYPLIQATASQLGLASQTDLFLALGTGVVISLVIGFAFRMTIHLLVGHFAMQFTNRIVEETLRDSLGAPYAWLRDQNGNTLAQRITLDIPVAGQDLYPVVLEILYGIFILLLGAAAILIVSSWEGIVVLFGIGAIGFAVLIVLNPRSAGLAARMRNYTLNSNRLAVEIFAGRKLIKAAQSEDFFVSRYLSVFRLGTYARMRLNVVNKAIPFATLLVGQIGIIAIALVLVLSDFTVGALVAQITFILLVLTRVLPAISAMSGSINILSNTEPFFRGFVALRTELLPLKVRKDPDAPDGRDRFENWRCVALSEVEFGYDSDSSPEIRGIDLAIERGQSIGIAGPSGAGKSTLVDLILGMLAPGRGCIWVDDYLLDDDSRSDWLSVTGYVPQEPYGIDDSLRRNIAFGVADADIDDCRIWTALEQVELDKLVRSWPRALDTRLGEYGSRLSGGQRQRVAIARTLYRGAKLLVLDEATNALDAETEQKINKMVRAIPGLTSIMVAHRLASLRGCDRILLMDGGRLVADGDFDDLIQNSSLFARLALETGKLS